MFKWDKKYLLIIAALLCLALYFYGSTLPKENPFLSSLPLLGGLAFGLNTLIQIAQ